MGKKLKIRLSLEYGNDSVTTIIGYDDYQHILETHNVNALNDLFDTLFVEGKGLIEKSKKDGDTPDLTDFYLILGTINKNDKELYELSGRPSDYVILANKAAKIWEQGLEDIDTKLPKHFNKVIVINEPIFDENEENIWDIKSVRVGTNLSRTVKPAEKPPEPPFVNLVTDDNMFQEIEVNFESNAKEDTIITKKLFDYKIPKKNNG
jgi:hypothetical protein